MNYFFDTNVIIGYTFRCDPFHDDSKNAFFNSEQIYYSFNVKKEFENQFKNIKCILEDFLMELSFQIKILRTKKIKKQDIFKIINNRYYRDDHFTKYVKSIDILWEKNSLTQEVKKRRILSILKKIILNFDSNSNSRKNIILKMINDPIKRSRNHEYLNCYNQLSGHPDSHKEDVIIILDAHHLCTQLSDGLNFVTSDDSIHNYAPGITSINDFLYPADI